MKVFSFYGVLSWCQNETEQKARKVFRFLPLFDCQLAETLLSACGINCGIGCGFNCGINCGINWHLLISGCGINFGINRWVVVVTTAASTLVSNLSCCSTNCGISCGFNCGINCGINCHQFLSCRCINCLQLLCNCGMNRGINCVISCGINCGTICGNNWWVLVAITTASTAEWF